MIAAAEVRVLWPESSSHYRPRPNPSLRRKVLSQEEGLTLPHCCAHVQKQEHAYFLDGFSSTYSWCLHVAVHLTKSFTEPCVISLSPTQMLPSVLIYGLAVRMKR
ncbi:hypothetical protein AVEN_196142-1 [Araneus ventricosus]|uniref:Uncharacterized protein n=1 Tax=Araneus ventricosus TaxID=182803 RepID=A0A4Y2E424_ARAVE|nr:hypothetical protein AVEN_196142-1 [Araneus ventricosus]